MINKYIIAVISSIFILCSPSLAADNPTNSDSAITESDDNEIYDPLEDINRAIFEFNWVVDKLLFRPIAEVYGELVPNPIRTCVHNAIGNLASPVTLINDILQLDVERSAETLARFIINTTFGIGGLFDVATEMGIVHHSEDFGLTMGSYGVGGGPYLILPLLGPSNFRDLIGKVADIFMDPFNWVVYNNNWDTWGYVRVGVDALDTRTESRSLIDSIEKSLDPYAQTRVLYTQHRDYRKSDDKEIVDTSDLPGGD